MSNVFGLDIEELTSVFDDSGSKEIDIEAPKPKEPDHDFEQRKRK